MTEIEGVDAAAASIAEGASRGVAGVSESDRRGHVADISHALEPIARPGGFLDEGSILIQSDRGVAARALILSGAMLYAVHVEISGDRARTAIRARSLADPGTVVSYDYAPAASEGQEGDGLRTSWTFRFGDGEELAVSGYTRHWPTDERDEGERFARRIAARAGLTPGR